MKKYYAVIDTNVVVSSFLKTGSIPDQIMNYCFDGTIVPILNEDILKEYRDVLTRNEFGIEEKIVDAFIEKIAKRAQSFIRTPTDENFVDLKDIVFYEIVLTARNYELAYLVTGNSKHFPIKPFIVTPKEMSEIIKKDKEKDK